MNTAPSTSTANRLRAVVARLGVLLPSWGNSRCLRCRRPWWCTEPRVVPFRDSGDQTSGQFALCTLCWRVSTPDERVAAHRTVTFGWREDRHDEWPAIELAVRYAEDVPRERKGRLDA